MTPKFKVGDKIVDDSSTTTGTYYRILLVDGKTYHYSLHRIDGTGETHKMHIEQFEGRNSRVLTPLESLL